MEPGRLEMPTRILQQGSHLGRQPRRVAGHQPIDVIDPEADTFHVKRRDGPGERLALFDDCGAVGSLLPLQERHELFDSPCGRLPLVSCGHTQQITPLTGLFGVGRLAAHQLVEVALLAVGRFFLNQQRKLVLVECLEPFVPADLLQ